MACDALFNNACFLFAFLPVVLLGYWAVPSRRWKLAWITIASFVFYGFWDVRFVVLLLFAATVDFGLALGMTRSSHRKRWLVASIVVNLAVLGFFKYAMFATDSARSVFDLVGLDVRIPGFSIVLPVGISFYTFQTMSYTIDVYQREVEATRDFLKYTAFVSLFPQLVAGPIVRYRSMQAQLDHLPTRLAPQAVATGIILFSIGLFKKVAVADPISRVIDPLWAQPGSLEAATAWLATIGYTLQLYFDFSGYSDMAIGLGALLGLAIPVNFRAPYQARDPSDFWRRWHISLSTFLRDYLYVPLGGNRKGRGRRLANLAIVMALGGLWHGAAWTFVVWGLYHGLLLVIHQAARPFWSTSPIAFQRVSMLLLVMMGWIFFRAPDLSAAGAVFHGLVSITPATGAAVREYLLPIVGVLAVLAYTQFARPTADMRFDLNPWRAIMSAILFSVGVILMLSESSPFLYYQF